MASPGFLHEKYLLTIGIFSPLDDRHAALSWTGRVLQLSVTNLRNRPLSSTSIRSMRETILSLYHNFITGSKDFPIIPYEGCFHSLQMATPFVPVDQEQRENTRPSPLMEGPAGMMVPPAGFTSAPSTILTPVLPEKADLGGLKADRRNCVRHMEFDGRTVIRVISPVYRSESTELTNRWRVGDYTEDETSCLMSVLCQFTKESVKCERRKKRKKTSSSSRLSPPVKRPRV